MDELIWEAPPEREDSRTYGPIFAELKKRPGAWARVKTGDTSSKVSNARAVFLRTSGDARFEARTAKISEDEYGLWARYRTAEQMKAAGS